MLIPHSSTCYMRKQSLFFFAFILPLLYCKAQSFNDKNFLSLSIGPSFPVGDYAKTNVNNNLAGFAKTGEQVELSFEHKLSKHFGLAVMLHGQRNTINTTAMSEEFSQLKFYTAYFTGTTGYPTIPPPPVTSSYYTYPNWKFDAKSWLTGSLLIGAAGDFPIDTKTNKLFITAKAMAGASYVSAPSMHGKSITDSTLAEVSQNGATAFAFSYLISGGLKYKLTQKLRLLFNVNYFGTSQAKFKNVTETLATAKGFTVPNVYTFPNAQSISSYSATGIERQSVSTIGLNVGIGLSL